MLARLAPPTHPNLLVGVNTADDAGVYRLSDDLALVITADYITPPVDDPYQFGQIAAANSLSDIYAMGGRPITAYNLVGFPVGELPLDVLGEILAGALQTVVEAGAVLAGGHTTDDLEPKFGLAVNGLVHPDKIWRNNTAKEGDVLILTKPIGSGVIFNAAKKGLVSPADLKRVVENLIHLNKTAAEVLARYTVHAVTDITGFGLAGHSMEMAIGAGLTFHFELGDIPVMAGVKGAYDEGVSTGANKENRAFVHQAFRMDSTLPDWRKEIIFDPQTSGGLLAAVPQAQARDVLRDLHAHGVALAAVVGHVSPLEDRPTPNTGHTHLIFH